MFSLNIWKKIYPLIKILAIFGFLFLISFFFENIFVIREIKIDSQDLKGISKLYKKNLFLLDVNKTKAWLQILNPKFKEIEIKKDYPNTLVIYSKKRKPLANLFVGEGFLIVDEEGVVLEKTKEAKSLPRIDFYQTLSYLSYSSGDKLDLKEIKLSLNFLSEIIGYLDVVSVDILSSDMIRLSIGKNDFEIKNILISSEKKLEEQIYNLKELLKYFKKNEIKNIEYIDLRFNKPVYKKN